MTPRGALANHHHARRPAATGATSVAVRPSAVLQSCENPTDSCGAEPGRERPGPWTPRPCSGRTRPATAEPPTPNRGLSYPRARPHRRPPERLAGSPASTPSQDQAGLSRGLAKRRLPVILEWLAGHRRRGQPLTTATSDEAAERVTMTVRAPAVLVLLTAASMSAQPQQPDHTARAVAHRGPTRYSQR